MLNLITVQLSESIFFYIEEVLKKGTNLADKRTHSLNLNNYSMLRKAKPLKLYCTNLLRLFGHTAVLFSKEQTKMQINAKLEKLFTKIVI